MPQFRLSLVHMCMIFTLLLSSQMDASIHDLFIDHHQDYVRLPSSQQVVSEINLEKFEKPFCMIGNGNPKADFKYKLKKVKRYQRKINRSKKNFKKNKKKEKVASLHGSAKWIVIKNLRSRGFSWDEIDFAFFSMTLFGEARNLKEDDIAMVARVINNRRKGRNYRQTVTELAQFSTWYYKNQRDNVNLLCPHPIHTKNWRKVVKVATRMFHRDDDKLGSTHYFAPHNMVPKYRLPSWAKGKYGARFGGHIFVFKNKEQAKVSKDKLFFIPRKAEQVRIRKGKVKF
jgi:hypothetical protein